MKASFKKVTAAALVALPLTMSGCASMDGQRGLFTAGGAGLGAAAGAILGDGRSNATSGALILGGAAAGALLGSQFEPACVNETNTNISRSINGNTESQWSGSQTYNENCLGRGGQNIPGANLPRSTQTNGFFVK